MTALSTIQQPRDNWLFPLERGGQDVLLVTHVALAAVVNSVVTPNHVKRWSCDKAEEY